MNMFEYWTLFNGIFLFLVLIGYAIYSIFNRKGVISEERKDELYACGERWKHQNIPSSSFLATLVDMMRVKKLSRMHTGNLSDYLLWIFSGIVVIMLLFVVL